MSARECLDQCVLIHIILQTFTIIPYWKSTSRELRSNFCLNLIETFQFERVQKLLYFAMFLEEGVFSIQVSILIYTSPSNTLLKTKRAAATEVSCQFQYRTCPEKGFFYFSLNFVLTRNYITILSSSSKARLNHYQLVTNLSHKFPKLISNLPVLRTVWFTTMQFLWKIIWFSCESSETDHSAGITGANSKDQAWVLYI